MAKRKKLLVELNWEITKAFEVEVPTDLADDDVENILYDCQDEFHDIEGYMPCPITIDGEGQMVVTKVLDREESFDSAYLYDPPEGN